MLKLNDEASTQEKTTCCFTRCFTFCWESIRARGPKKRLSDPPTTFELQEISHHGQTDKKLPPEHDQAKDVPASQAQAETKEAAPQTLQEGEEDNDWVDVRIDQP